MTKPASTFVETLTPDPEVLDTVFRAPDEDIETFVDAIRETFEVGGSSSAGNDIAHLVRSGMTGDADKVEAPLLTERVSGFIRIQSGWDKDHHVWHIAPATNRRNWKVTEERVTYAIAQVMNKYIPQTVEVKVFLPNMQWDIREFTFKAMALKGVWSVTEADLNKLALELLAVLNTLV